MSMPIKRALLGAGVAAGAVLLTGIPANAAPSPQPTEVKAGAYDSVASAKRGGPNGNGCDFSVYSTKVWGWCDGRGPERYAIYAKCSNGRWYKSSSHPWWGDRRGAWVYCPSGTRVTAFKGDWA